MGCVLRCVETPPVGGDTIWVDMVAAYERLPEDVKARIAGLRARHSIEASFGAAMPDGQSRTSRDSAPGIRRFRERRRDFLRSRSPWPLDTVVGPSLIILASSFLSVVRLSPQRGDSSTIQV